MEPIYQKYIELFKIIFDKYQNSYLGKKTTQNLFYFLERQGIDLNLRYSIHFYGPYSSKLDNTLHLLENEHYINIDTSGPTHKITLVNDDINDSVLTENDLNIANIVMDNFASKSASDLEALSTMDYIANILLNTTDENTIKDKFKEIKGNKFDTNKVDQTFDELKKLKYIN